MNQQNDVIPVGGEASAGHPPAERPAPSAAEQAPLGAHPGYEDVLDTAVDYTFPCSDPIAIDQSCADCDDAPPAGQGPSIG